MSWTPANWPPGSRPPGSITAETLAAELAAELADDAAAALGQRQQRDRLAEAGPPCYELPWLGDGIDLGGLYRLAAALKDQGAA